MDNVSVKHEASDTSALYYYDSENMMTHACIDGTWSYYAYDFAGRRVKKQAGATTTYVYDGDEVIAEYENDVLKRKFIYGPGIDEPIMMVVCGQGSGDRYYYHYDGLGSVVALTNSSGNIVEQYSYDVFGKPNTTSSVGNPYLFTARRYDPETELYHYRARYYSADLGRFLQTDPIGYWEGMNLYTYVHNNPVIWVDPFGLQKDTLDFKSCSITWSPSCGYYPDPREYPPGPMPGDWCVKSYQRMYQALGVSRNQCIMDIAGAAFDFNRGPEVCVGSYAAIGIGGCLSTPAGWVAVAGAPLPIIAGIIHCDSMVPNEWGRINEHGICE